MDSMNEFEPTPTKGFVDIGIEHCRTAYIESDNVTLRAGDFVVYDNVQNSTLKGLVVKKNFNSATESIGVVTTSIKSDTYTNASGENVLTIAPMNVGIEIYLEAFSAFQRGDALELKEDNGVHYVQKKAGNNKQVGVAHEVASNKGDKVLVLLRSV